MPDRRGPADLDEALDVALRGLTDAPATDLRARVLARIAGAAAARPALPRIRWSLALPAAAVLAAVAWSGWAIRRSGPGRPSPAVVTAAVPVESPVSPSTTATMRPAPAVPASVSPRARALPRRPAERTLVAGRSRTVEDDEPAGLSPLSPPAPILAAALAAVPTRSPSPLDVPALTVEPLADVADASPGLP
jgi:hypothetical protein